jgi:hypothetical protein
MKNATSDGTPVLQMPRRRKTADIVSTDPYGAPIGEMSGRFSCDHARLLIAVEITPLELSLLIEVMQARALRAADDPDQIDFADYLFRRVAELREAGR